MRIREKWDEFYDWTFDMNWENVRKLGRYILRLTFENESMRHTDYGMKNVIRNLK